MLPGCNFALTDTAFKLVEMKNRHQQKNAKYNF